MSNLLTRVILVVASILVLVTPSIAVLPATNGSGSNSISLYNDAINLLGSGVAATNTPAFASANATLGSGLDSNSVSVSILVTQSQLLVAGLTYSTAGSVSSINGIASITDTQGLTWTHILNSGITGGDKGVDVYFATAASTGKESVTLTPSSITFKTAFVSTWSASAVDLTHAVSTCNPGSATSISTTVTTGGRVTIAAFSADDGQINNSNGPGVFHFDFFNIGPNGVSIDVDDVAVSSSGTFTYTWMWSNASTACTVAVPIGTKIRPLPGTPFDLAAATRGSGLNPDSVSVSLPVKAKELLVAGLTYSTAGSVSSINGIGAISDSQGLVWTHILNSGITGGDKGVDIYYAIATSTGTDTFTLAPQTTTFKTAFVSSWSASAIDLTHAVSTCNAGFASSISTTVTTNGRSTIGVFSANDGQLSSSTGSGVSHFDFYNTGPNGVSINVDDVALSSSGTFSDTWIWNGSTTDCTIAFPLT